MEKEMAPFKRGLCIFFIGFGGWLLFGMIWFILGLMMDVPGSGLFLCLSLFFMAAMFAGPLWFYVVRPLLSLHRRPEGDSKKAPPGGSEG